MEFGVLGELGLVPVKPGKKNVLYVFASMRVVEAVGVGSGWWAVW